MQTNPNMTENNTVHTDKGAGFSTGLLVGGLVGAAAALLLTPKSGKDLREVLTQESVKLKDKSLQVKDEALLQAHLGAKNAKEKMTNAASTVKDKANTLSFSAKQKLKEARSGIMEEDSSAGTHSSY